jgi:hypothetical protein
MRRSGLANPAATVSSGLDRGQNPCGYWLGPLAYLCEVQVRGEASAGQGQRLRLFPYCFRRWPRRPEAWPWPCAGRYFLIVSATRHDRPRLRVTETIWQASSSQRYA